MAVSHTNPTVLSNVRVHPWLVPRTSTQNGVLVKASNAVLPVHTTASAVSPGGGVAARRRSDSMATAAESAPNPSPVASQLRPQRSPPSTAATA